MSLLALPPSDVVVIGAGIIGLATALELRVRGVNVTVLERDAALAHASTAAAGMLAARDPHNPSQLQALSDFSLSKYPEFLARIADFSGATIPYQTDRTVQYGSNASQTVLAEHSIDPRQLAPALLAAARKSSVHILEYNEGEEPLGGPQIIHTTGAWAGRFGTTPRKGQMLRVELPSAKALQEVHRAEHIYVVPRTRGPQAGTALIGATVEDAGFDVSVSPEDLAVLRHTAVQLAPDLHFLADAPFLEAWAGLRPSTPDGLPIIGRLNEREIVATGHFRNGILLAPGTAKLVADLVEGKTQPKLDLDPFRAGRFPTAQL